jgi:hypothetical protein
MHNDINIDKEDMKNFQNIVMRTGTQSPDLIYLTKKIKTFIENFSKTFNL